MKRNRILLGDLNAYVCHTDLLVMLIGMFEKLTLVINECSIAVPY